MQRPVDNQEEQVQDYKTLLSEFTFYISPLLPNQPSVKQLILEHGGKVVSKEAKSNSVLSLVPREKLSPSNGILLAVDFVLDCVKKGRVVSTEDYSYRSPSTKAKQKKKFTKVDDAAMLAYIETLEKNGCKEGSYSPNAIEFWKAAAALNVTSHPAESMRGRYKNKIRHYSQDQKRSYIEFFRAQKQSANVPQTQAQAPPSPPEEMYDFAQQPETQAVSPELSPSEAQFSTHLIDSPLLATQAQDDVDLPEEDFCIGTRPLQTKSQHSKAHTSAASARATRVPVTSTPDEHPSTLDNADRSEDLKKIHISISHLQHSTGQSHNAIVHALYYSTGHPDIAEKFLRGQYPPEFWSQLEDDEIHQLGSTEEEVAEAIESYSFKEVERYRTKTDILARFRFITN